MIVTLYTASTPHPKEFSEKQQAMLTMLAAVKEMAGRQMPAFIPSLRYGGLVPLSPERRMKAFNDIYRWLPSGDRRLVDTSN